ncbi:glutathione S-transferase family protein [Rhizobium lemnae]|uniref:Glutathione S-transferase family protein n=1 Tax=Rhizobium lemnae TaxID=1214924 RepID=A0ABV8EAD6_9HYPH|nr:glutathione S-transferase family protein [Rhizobium lemnae]MCJ8508104.1 glutathione S-transferase family protein [Rhizobium lemnae]
MDRIYVTRGSGNCFKPFLASSYCDKTLDFIDVNLLGGEHKSDAFLAINDRGQVPYMVTGSGVGIGESNAMLWLIADGSDLMPDTAVERARSLQWMFFEQSKLEPFISPARFLTFIAPQLGKGRESDIANWLEKARSGLANLDAHLGKSSFMLGERYGITDIAVFGYVHVSHEAGIDMAEFPAVQRWIDRVASTPRFRPLAELCINARPFSQGLA